VKISTPAASLSRFAQQNCIWEISGLETLVNLDTLNISNNHVEHLETLACCPALHTLLASHNRLETLESISHLALCQGLTTLDLQGNKLEDPEVGSIPRSLFFT
jgi:dynein assembly factor 1, axonemal